MPPVIPNRQNIEDGTISESRYYDFKQQINLDDHGKSSFIDDIVAFLNRGAGHLIVGVKELKGKAKWGSWLPVPGDQDAWSQRIQSWVQTNIEPKPMDVETHFIELENGDFAMDIRIPEHGRRPYQNRITGGFKIRTDKQNTVISRADLLEMYRSERQALDDFQKRWDVERNRLSDGIGIAVTGPVLEIAVMPVDSGKSPLDRSHVVGWRYPYQGKRVSDLFGTAEGGSSIITMAAGRKLLHRLFIADDWFVLSTIRSPFQFVDTGSGIEPPMLMKMIPELEQHLEDLRAILIDAGVKGPYLMQIAFSHLHDTKDLKIFFPGEQVIVRDLGVVDDIYPARFADLTYQAIERASGNMGC